MGTPKNTRKSIAIIALVVFIDLVGFSIIFPLFPAMLSHYLASEGPDSAIAQLHRFLSQFAGGGENGGFYTEVLFGGILGSLYSLLQFVFAPIWGRLSDRIGRRNVLLVTTVGMTVSYLIWFFSGKFGVFIIARALGGVMAGNLSVATAAVADVTTPQNRAKAMGMVGAAFGLGFVVGPALGGASSMLDLSVVFPSLAEYGVNPFSMAALVALVLAFANWLWVVFEFHETLPEEKRASKESKRPKAWAMFTVKEADIRHVIMVYFLFILAFSGMEFTLTFLAVERLGYGPREMIKIFIFIGLVLILTQGGLVRRLAPKMGERKLTTYGLASSLGSFVLLALATGPWMFYAALALLGVGAGLVSPLTSSLCSRYSSEQDQGKHLGIYRSAGSLARAIGPFVAAVQFWKLGSQTAYLIGAIWVIIPFWLSYHLHPPPEHQPK